MSNHLYNEIFMSFSLLAFEVWHFSTTVACRQVKIILIDPMLENGTFLHQNPSLGSNSVIHLRHQAGVAPI